MDATRLAEKVRNRLEKIEAKCNDIERRFKEYKGTEADSLVLYAQERTLLAMLQAEPKPIDELTAADYRE